VTAVPVQLYGINYNTRKGADWQPASLKCETYLEVKTDLTLLSRITNRIRILSLTDCGQGELVLGIAKELGLQVWLGIWVSADPNVFDMEVAALQDLLSRGWIDDTVLGISVGSESIYRKEVTIDESIALEDQVKQILVDAGRDDVLVSICDIAPTYQYNSQLVTAIDIVVVNSFPFWEAIDINDATDYLLEEINPIESVAASQGKRLIMGETGWPSDGFLSGVGIASHENQAQFLTDFYCRCDKELGWEYYYFTGIDNAWRQEQDANNTVEGNWGIIYANLTVKPWFQDLAFTCSDGVEYSFAEIDWTIPEIAAPPTISPAPTSALGDAACAAHANCVAVDLVAGNCCPTDGADGIRLGCCDPLTDGGSTPPTAGGMTSSTSPAPVSSTPTAAVTTEPSTSSPTATTVSTPSLDSEPTVANGSEPQTPAPSGGPPTTVEPTLGSGGGGGGGSLPEPTPSLENAQPSSLDAAPPASLNPTSNGTIMATCIASIALMLGSTLITVM
jgi:exo-beta-1,3-glucanase (GH17 family)